MITDGSTCGRAGRRFRRIIVFVFLVVESAFSVVVVAGRVSILLTVVRLLLGEDGGEADGESFEGGGEFDGIGGISNVSTFAIVVLLGKNDNLRADGVEI